MVKLFAAALALLPLVGASLAIGNIFASYMNAVGKNPTEVKDVATVAYVGAAMTELIALICGAVAFVIILG